MNKKQILEALQDAKVDYKQSIELCNDPDIDTIYKYINALSKLGTADGFCYYFMIKSLYSDFIIDDYIINELKKDIENYKSKIYWYSPPCIQLTINGINGSLNRRLNHLNRTIARLEKELQTTQQS